ncbi:MAG: acetolactate synthase small subunit [Prevotellaceae bacterium]|jgi:acetolactate synthase-1/3 small subunit|nr:acetolactate synthase small subunit [Prevotellaceae bacterium]
MNTNTQTLYTVTVYSENHVGLLTQISNIFTRRFINIESLTVSASAMKGVHKFTITCYCDEKLIEKLVRQIEKKIDVLTAYCYVDDEIISREIALFKVTTETLMANNAIESMVNRYNAKIIEVNSLYTVIEKTGGKAEIQQLFGELEPFGILQFVRSGSVSITRSKYEHLSDVTMC